MDSLTPPPRFPADPPAAPANSRSADAGPQPLSPWFAVTGLLLLATLLAAAFVQARQFTMLNLTLQYQDDYLVLSLYQLESESLRLRERLQQEAELPDSAALQLRYDIFVSRVGLLETARAQRLLAQSEVDAAVLADIKSFIRRADLYLGGEPRSPLSAQAAQALRADLLALDAPIHRLLLQTTHRVAVQLTERQAQVRQHNRVGLALTGFLLAMLMVFGGLVLRQMGKLEQRRQRLERLAEQLRDARIEAEAASEAKSSFLLDLSHELRTPLHGLLGMLSLVKDSPRDPRAAGWLTSADDSAQHLLRLLDDILDLSKLEAGALTLVPAAVNLSALLREVQSLLLPLAAAKGLALHLELDPSLPPLVQLDATRVRQVLFNLLANAIKFSESGTIVLHGRRRAGPELPAMLEFDVADTGIGMDREMVVRLFHRFGRSDDPRARREGGTGLGLAISRNLARLMGGEIAARSTPGAGSVFSFRCPLLPATQLPATPLAPADASGRVLHVLLAEDHPVNRLYLAALLARLGHRTRVVENGQDALQAVQQQPTLPGEPPFDLVLMDVHMPVLDGVAATQAIRALPAPGARVCVVALTADVLADTRARCMAAGVDEVVTKPLSLGELRALLSRRFGSGMAAPGPLPVPTPSDASGSALPGLLDHATVHSVRDLMGSEQVPSLYGGFFTQAEDAARRMRDAMRDADPEALRRSAHTVKGAALNLGLPALAEAASLLNREASTLGAPHLALAVQRYEEITAATRALCAGEGLLN